MRVLRNAADLDAFLGGRGWRAGRGPVIVPTMGALHAGHERLIREGSDRARDEANPLGCVVWIFVNPTQFTDQFDLARYPRTLDADIELCRRSGAAAAFAPPVADIYPPGLRVSVPTLPEVATAPGLEDAARPGHFAGVCQVVHRFFQLMRPSVAMFGEKDWQQLAVIREMVRMLSLDIEIQSVPTVREPDGLAMSSRNRFLDSQSRARATCLFRALCAASTATSVGEAESVMMSSLIGAGADVDYAVIRDGQSLAVLPPNTPHASQTSQQSRRALVAARIGGVRLIDNCDWPQGPGFVPSPPDALPVAPHARRV
jgi:pantoate--beta-alanine ligase